MQNNKIHKFMKNGLRIMLDVPSGAVHVVDEITWDVMDVYNGANGEEIPGLLAHKYERGEVLGVLEELRKMQQEGVLFADEAKPVEVFEAPAVIKASSVIVGVP